MKFTLNDITDYDVHRNIDPDDEFSPWKAEITAPCLPSVGDDMFPNNNCLCSFTVTNVEWDFTDPSDPTYTVCVVREQL